MTLKNLILLTIAIAFCIQAQARDYFVYSVMHELPMSETHKPKKNFYVNFGQKQGLKQGTVLDVYRTIIQNDPFETKKRYNYRIKVGEIKVVHANEDAAIAVAKAVNNGANDPLLEISNIMIGDEVKVHLD